MIVVPENCDLRQYAKLAAALQRALSAIEDFTKERFACPYGPGGGPRWDPSPLNDYANQVTVFLIDRTIEVLRAQQKEAAVDKKKL